MVHPLLDLADEAHPSIRLYTYNGMAISFSSEIENTMFWCLVGASGTTVEVATNHFYRPGKFEKMRHKVDEAVSAKLTGDPHLAWWKALNERLKSCLGEGNSDRNLVGHNPVATSVYVSAPLTECQEEKAVLLVSEVRQSKRMVDYLERSERIVRSDDMRVYCAKLIDLYLDLERFAEEALRIGHAHELRRGHA